MNMNISRPYFLIALITASSILSFFVFRPFLIVLILAAIFAVVLHPLYKSILRRMSGVPGAAAGVTMAIAAVCILMPLSFIAVQIVGDAGRLHASLTEGRANTYIDAVFMQADSIIAKQAPSLALSAAELSASIDEYMKSGLLWLVQNIGGAFGSAARMLLYLFIFLIALYYLLRDGSKLRQIVIAASPLSQTDDEIVFNRLELAIRSVIRGSLTIALLQGVLTGIGFTAFGVPHPVLWGVAAALSALIPGIGTSLVLAPGVAYLFIVGEPAFALGLLAWSILAVGMIDNFLGPRLIGKGMQLHPLIVLLSVFGGLAFFGAPGIFLGPLSISLLFALVSIYPEVVRQ